MFKAMIPIILCVPLCGCLLDGENAEAEAAKREIIAAEKKVASLKDANKRLEDTAAKVIQERDVINAAMKAAEQQYAKLAAELASAPESAKPVLRGLLNDLAGQIATLGDEAARAGSMVAAYQAEVAKTQSAIASAQADIAAAGESLDALLSTVEERRQALTGGIRTATGIAANSGVPFAGVVGEMLGGLSGLAIGGATTWWATRRRAAKIGSALEAAVAAISLAGPNGSVADKLHEQATVTDLDVIRRIIATDNLPAIATS